MKPKSITTIDNAKLEGIRNHDAKVLRALFEECLPPVKKYVLQNSGTAEDAEDIFMDALEVVYRKIKKGSFHLTCTLCTYLFAVCKNLWLKKLRRKKIESRVTSNGWDVSILGEVPEEEMTGMDNISLYRDKWLELSADARKVLHLFYFEKKSMKEIAIEMGYGSEGYARKRKYQCMKQLKKLIRDDLRSNFR
jgi:RNA polymerase sigma factor (sigma-70 family)